MATENNKREDKFSFRCPDCGRTHKMACYAIAQLSSGNSLDFTCTCDATIHLDPEQIKD